jgi:hypothetical protein
MELRGGLNTRVILHLLIKKVIFVLVKTLGNPKIYYKGIISEKEQVNDEGEFEEISSLKEDILKLLDNE